jgi:hypothetical protein
MAPKPSPVIVVTVLPCGSLTRLLWVALAHIRWRSRIRKDVGEWVANGGGDDRLETAHLYKPNGVG